MRDGKFRTASRSPRVTNAACSSDVFTGALADGLHRPKRSRVVISLSSTAQTNAGSPLVASSSLTQRPIPALPPRRSLRGERDGSRVGCRGACARADPLIDDGRTLEHVVATMTRLPVGWNSAAIGSGACGILRPLEPSKQGGTTAPRSSKRQRPGRRPARLFWIAMALLLAPAAFYWFSQLYTIR